MEKGKTGAIRSERCNVLPPAASLLVLAAVAALLVCVGCFADDESLLVFRADARLWHGEWWRAITYFAFHGSSEHLAINVAMLVFFGWMAARCYRLSGWLAVLVASALLAGLIVPLTTNQGLIGASPAGYALFGMFVAAVMRSRARGVDDPFMLHPALFIAAIFLDLIVSMQDGRVSVFSHAFGLMVGFFCGMLIPLDESSIRPARAATS